MTNNALQPLCASCGQAVVGVDGSRGVRCGPCFDTYLRSVDADFLDHYAEFGARSRQVVAETCLRALVLANTGDRKLLGMTIYEQFVNSASDLVALVAALRARSVAPIARTFLDFHLDAEDARRFFAGVATLSGVEMLATLGLPAPAPARPGRARGGEADVSRALRLALADLHRLSDFRDLGERALALASDHLRNGVTLAERTGWLAGRELSPTQVAAIAMDTRSGRIDIAALRVDEERLAQVVDAIDVMTRLTRNIIHAFVHTHEPAAFINGFPHAPRVRAG